MKTIIHKITAALTKISTFLASFGPFGLLAIAFLDSLMVPLPGGVDGFLMLLSSSKHSWMLIYVASATVGSTVGSVGLYRISRRAGHRALARFSESKQKRVKNLIDRYDVLVINRHWSDIRKRHVVPILITGNFDQFRVKSLTPDGIEGA